MSEAARARNEGGRDERRPSASDAQMIRATHNALDLLLSKWKIDLIYLLASGVRRHSRLHDNLLGASKKVMTETLRSLERDGLVRRQIFAEVPVRVEYSLTPLGWSLTEPLMALAEWSERHFTRVEQARMRVAARNREARAPRTTADGRAR